MTRKLIEIERGHYKKTGPQYLFIDPEPLDDPACARDIDDPASVFAAYLRPKIKSGRDEASKEVREYLKVENLADAVAHTIQSLPEKRTAALRAWVDEALSSRIYLYADVDLRGEEVEMGIMLTTGGPRDAEVARVLLATGVVGASYASYGDYEMRRSFLHTAKNATPGFRKKPIGLELANKFEYDDVAEQLGFRRGTWKGPGIYDLNNRRVTFVGTRDAFRHATALQRAEVAIDDVRYDARHACVRLREQLAGAK